MGKSLTKTPGRTKQEEKRSDTHIIKFNPKFYASVYTFLISMQKIFSDRHKTKNLARNIKRQFILLLFASHHDREQKILLQVLEITYGSSEDLRKGVTVNDNDQIIEVDWSWKRLRG